VDAAIMAAAVVNWIPAVPFPGKMSTEGYQENDIIQVPFRLAPCVINQMRKWNPRLGCKLLSGSLDDDLRTAAFKVMDDARCHAVVANDLSDLKTKKILHADGAEFQYQLQASGWYFEHHLLTMIEDEYFHTRWCRPARTPVQRDLAEIERAKKEFDAIVERYRERFLGRKGKTFGSMAVRLWNGERWLCSPREKGNGLTFSSKDAVIVMDVDWLTGAIWVMDEPDTYPKATLNAPLLIHVGEMSICGGLHSENPVQAVLHLHEQLPGVPTVPYAPPGTRRDNDRFTVPGFKAFNIDGHGFVTCLNPSLDIMGL